MTDEKERENLYKLENEIVKKGAECYYTITKGNDDYLKYVISKRIHCFRHGIYPTKKIILHEISNNWKDFYKKTIITNEDYHIVLFTSINLTNMLLLFTLLVAGFFGYRYIDKVKTKILNKYEIERLAKLLDKTTDEKLKLIEKSSNVQADLNAVLSKILELKRHIDRINIQILENLAKLNEPFV